MAVHLTDAALKALADAATPGPWTVRNDNEGSDPAYGPLWKVESPDPSPDDEPYFEATVFHGCKSDAEFIAACREAVPALLARLEASEAATRTERALRIEKQEERNRYHARLSKLEAAGRKVVVWGRGAIAACDRLALLAGVEPARRSETLEELAALLDEGRSAESSQP